MLKIFYPNMRIHSTYSINFEQLYADGYRGIIFDIDNTLVPHGYPADERAKKLFARLKTIGFDCCLLSNNQEPRVKMFQEDIGLKYIYDAHKPSVAGYEKAMERMGTDRTDTLFIGDQIFTDVFGANRTGLFTILVDKIYWKEEIQIVFKRYLEKIVLLGFAVYSRRRMEDTDGPRKLKGRYAV